MAETTIISDKAIQTTKKYNLQIWFLIVLVLLVISIGINIFLILASIENRKQVVRQARDISKLVPTSEPSSTLSPTPVREDFIELLSPTNSETLNYNQTYKIQWNQRGLEGWGNRVILCMVGYDKEEKEIPALKKWNEPRCTYRASDLSGSYLIAETVLSNGSFDWTIPFDLPKRYENAPTKYKVRLMVFDNLPEEGRTEWAGNVGWDESRDYLNIEVNN